MSTPLLSTKLAIPPLRPDLVLRPRLIERLDEALRAERRLGLVSAPAGFGKTTLVAAWLRRLNRLGDAPSDVAWLSLDEGDSDPARFLAYLLAALRSVDPTIGQIAGEIAQPSPQMTPERLLTALINDIAARSRPLVLALDDYHLVSALPVHQQLTFLLEHRPAQLHLVIASREDPPLPLARLRARGHIVEIRQADLEFTPAEAAEFFRCAVRRELTAADMAALHARAEGWIAGLQLAALSLPSHGDVQEWLRNLAGSQRYILDYLIEEVFHRQPRAIQDFLLSTSILDRLTASLCSAVAETENSQDMLVSLEQSNLFIVPLDDSRAWYRYHHLFADVLRHRLHAERAAQIPNLHRRASQWYAAHGFLPDAIRHALAASDWDAAAELILGGTSRELLERGELMTLLGWFRAFPEPIVRGSARLCCEYAWPLMLIGQTEAAESYLNQAGAFFDTPLGLLAPDRLPERALVLLNLGMARWYKGHLAEAQEMLSSAQSAGHNSGDTYAWLTASIFLNRIQLAHGKLHQAAATCAEIIRQGVQLPIGALAYYDLGWLHHEWNELETAAAWTAEGIRLSGRNDGCDELQAAGFATLAFIRQAQGRATAAREALQLAAEKLQHSECSPAGRLYCLTTRILVALAQGDVRAAALAAEEVPSSQDAHTIPDYLPLERAQARVLLAQGKRAAAAEQLAALYETAAGLGWRVYLPQVRAVQALAAAAPDQALELLAGALAQAEPEGYVRTFLDLGEPMAVLLDQALARNVAPVYVRRLLRAFAAASQPRQDHLAASLTGLAENLTQREIEVLRLLAGRLTNQEIAAKLYVSGNTVKTHLAAIYGKLGARDRREAITRARGAGLLA